MPLRRWEVFLWLTSSKRLPMYYSGVFLGSSKGLDCCKLRSKWWLLILCFLHAFRLGRRQWEGERESERGREREREREKKKRERDSTRKTKNIYIYGIYGNIEREGTEKEIEKERERERERESRTTPSFFLVFFFAFLLLQKEQGIKDGDPASVTKWKIVCNFRPQAWLANIHVPKTLA